MRRPVFVSPAPAWFTDTKLRAELTAAGVPLEPQVGAVILDCQYVDNAPTGRVFVVIVDVADVNDDQWDATVRQVVAAHVPNARETSKQRRKRLLDQLLNIQEELQVVRQLAEAQESLKLFQSIRTWNNQLLTQLLAANVPLTINPLPGKTWNQYKADILATAKAIIDAE